MGWSFVEKKLDEAAKAGAFDHLPPAGPIDLTENPYVPEDWRLAFKLLADKKIVPEFAERRKEIEGIRAELDGLKADGTRDRNWRRLAYRNRLVLLSGAVQALNGSLARENQFIRSSLQLPPVDLDGELRAFDAAN